MYTNATHRQEDGGKIMQPDREGKADIGCCKSVAITCVSETGWLDENVWLKNVERAGGREVSQWSVDWDETNSAGYSSLIEIEGTDGARRRFLLDSGWNNDYMDAAFEREGVDEMLKKREIEFLYVTHEHFDHYFGVASTLKYDPDITVMVPNTLHDEGYRLLAGGEFPACHARNPVPHRGKLIRHDPDVIYQLYPGCASVTFSIDIPFRVQGEQSLFFNVEDKGIVCVTGCCHQNITAFADFARDRIQGGENLYGLYGGLHIAPVGALDAAGEKTVMNLGKYGFKKIACNHCTGVGAVKKMVGLGYPVAGGSARNGSLSDLYLGNGDRIVF